MKTSRFVDLLSKEFKDVDDCQGLLRQYFSTEGKRFTGSQFENLCDYDNENVFTARDLIAVQSLSVDIPIRVAIWLLGDEGTEAVTKLLTRVKTDVEIWDPKAESYLAENGPLWELWNLLSTASWPDPDKSNEMGRTKISKLIATKRPKLSPILDQVITKKMFPDTKRFWDSFRDALSDKELRNHISRVTNIPEVPTGVSLLRRIDVVLWSRHH